jgi:hypothetical protein
MGSLGGVGLFAANMLTRMHIWDGASSFALTMLAVLILAPLSIIPASRAGFVLILLEGVGVVAMVLLSVAVLWRVFKGNKIISDIVGQS